MSLSYFVLPCSSGVGGGDLCKIPSVSFTPLCMQSGIGLLSYHSLEICPLFCLGTWVELVVLCVHTGFLLGFEIIPSPQRVPEQYAFVPPLSVISWHFSRLQTLYRTVKWMLKHRIILCHLSGFFFFFTTLAQTALNCTYETVTLASWHKSLGCYGKSWCFIIDIFKSLR